MSGRHYWGLIPAAGAGLRVGTGTPKQYLPLRGRPVIGHTLDRMFSHPLIKDVVVVLAADDPWWSQVKLHTQREPMRVVGGAERCHSVMNGLLALEQRAEPDDWILVHDAVRPCVRTSDIERLMDRLAGHRTGGLLGLPVRDTMKRCGINEEVMETVSREGLWHALTPQMFRLEPLRRAMEHSLENGVFVTDEAQAMELTGCTPLIVEGHADNIKITRRVDMSLADIILARQESDG